MLRGLCKVGNSTLEWCTLHMQTPQCASPASSLLGAVTLKVF